MNYKYHLLKYHGPSSRLTCPSCGRPHCFAPYVDKDEQIVGEEYGRCNHESSCGYVKYPPSERDWRESYSEYRQHTQKYRPKVVAKPQPKPEPKDGYCTIPMDIVLKTVRTNPESDFVYFLRTMFDPDTVTRLIDEYYIGVTKSGDAIFYQMDSKGRCRGGKVVKYNRETGKRIQDPNVKNPITWVHSLLMQRGMLSRNWELTQCLFGEHLLKKYPDKPVILVEAEKTAIIGSALMPKFVWVAVGGKSQLGDKVEVMDGRTILAFPDVDGYDKWVEKINERPYLNIQVSDFVNKYAQTNGLGPKADVADVLIHWMQHRTSIPTKEPQAPPPKELYADNPVMQEVMKYFAPEHWDNVDALIRELDLELVGVSYNNSGQLPIHSNFVNTNKRIKK